MGDVARAARMYCTGLGLEELGRFVDHQGFDGVMLGTAASGFHFEFTHCRERPVTPSPTAEDLLVIYLPDRVEWLDACERMLAAGFRNAAPYNPYWNQRGRTFEDDDGYRVLLERDNWPKHQ